MQHKTLLFFSVLAFLIPTSVFAQCVIGGTSYPEAVMGRTACEVCDSARSATEWSPLICTLPVDAACQVDRCDDIFGCISKKLPEHTRCVDPVCANGSITQTECTKDGICGDLRTKSCQGFACLDAVSCTTECQDDDDCESPAMCAGQICKIPAVSEDMGSDASVSDMGRDMTLEVDLPTADMSDKDMNRDGSDIDIDNRPVASDGGCSTGRGSTWLGLLIFGCFAIIGRGKKRA